MTIVWNVPLLEMLPSLSDIHEKRPTALLTGQTAWQIAASQLKLPLVVQAEPISTDVAFLDTLADGLPPQVEVVYGVGGGLAADAAKYVGWKTKKPVVIVPTSLSVDGFFTAVAALRKDDGVHYVSTGPAERVYIDLDLIAQAPAHLRGAGIVELLTIVTGLLDWQYAAKLNKNTHETRFLPWAAGVMAGIAQQAFKIAQGVGEGRTDALEDLLDLMCMEVQLTNQIGHTRPQEGSEQFLAYALESRISHGRPMPYGDLVAPSILVSMALHRQNVQPIRDTLKAAGVRLNQVRGDEIIETLKQMPSYVRNHRLPYTILNDIDPNSDEVNNVLHAAQLA
jgi:glycerol-1-phosphate dehydrogenase [NAD(P)+]